MSAFRRFLAALRARYAKGAVAACACLSLVACTATPIQ
jgi:hypothetical protein